MDHHANKKAYLAEFTGTFLIVTSTLVSYRLFEGMTYQYLFLALINGLVVSLSVWVGFKYSEAHFNPFITMA